MSKRVLPAHSDGEKRVGDGHAEPQAHPPIALAGHRERRHSLTDYQVIEQKNTIFSDTYLEVIIPSR
jgi:hypothetical protein